MRSIVIPSGAQRSRGISSSSDEVSPLRASRSGRGDGGVGRRAFLAAAALVPFGARVVSATPPVETITSALIEAAKKEGKVSYYTAMDVYVAGPIAKDFIQQLGVFMMMRG